MDREAINTLLYRNIKKGTEFNTLMPFSDCSSVKLAKGDTKVTIDNMSMWAYKYQHHTKTLTENIFKDLSLEKLCSELHQFLFHHFQYKIDESTQKLRSPACSWSSRQQGIDCKSYTIFASAVLLNRGVIHYLRRVEVNQGEGYSHVYAIVPKDQKTGNINEGYYVIDGTINTTEEQAIFKADDVKMTPISSAQLGFVKSGLAKGFSSLISAGVQSFIEHLNSCSDARYDKGIVALRIQRDLKEVLQNKIELLDEAIEMSNDARIENLFNELLKEVDLGFAHLSSETAGNTYDDCAFEVLTQALAFAEKLKQYIDSYLDNFIKTQLRFAVTVKEHNGMTSERTYYFVVGQADNPVYGEYRQITIEKPKHWYGVNPVVPFGENPEHWLIENKRHFAKTYNTTVARNYENEVRPDLVHIKKLRNSVHLGGENLYFYEKPHHRNLYKIFLKYDQNYAELSRKQNRDLQAANLKTIKQYEIELEETIAEDKKARQRKKLKKQIGYGVAAFAVLYLILNTSESYE